MRVGVESEGHEGGPGRARLSRGASVGGAISRRRRIFATGGPVADIGSRSTRRP
jgi:hypothetical protein